MRRWRAVSGSNWNYSRNPVCGLGSSNSPHPQIFTDFISFVAVIRFDQRQGNIWHIFIFISFLGFSGKSCVSIILLWLLLLTWEYFLYSIKNSTLTVSLLKFARWLEHTLTTSENAKDYLVSIFYVIL